MVKERKILTSKEYDEALEIIVHVSSLAADVELLSMSANEAEAELDAAYEKLCDVIDIFEDVLALDLAEASRRVYGDA